MRRITLASLAGAVFAMAMALVATGTHASRLSPNQAVSPRMVIWEFFSNDPCVFCESSGPVVDQLQVEYAAKPVLFLEQQIGTTQPTVNRRDDNFWLALGGTRAQTPFNSIDSGFVISYGDEDYRKVYKAKLDKELRRVAGADVKVRYERDRTGAVNARIDVTNRTDRTLGPANVARVHVLVYEDEKVAYTSRFVRAGSFFPLDEDLEPGKSASYELTVTPDKLRNVTNLNKFKVVGFIEYRPGGTTGAFDMLNAAMGEQGPLVVPTATATTSMLPTATSTPVPLPTTEPMPTAVPPTSVPPTTVPPTSVPPTAPPATEVPPTNVPPTTVPPTANPPGRVIFLPMGWK